MKKSALLLHLALFSFGYSMATFAIPPFFTSLGADQLYLGQYGFILMLPNFILPIFFMKIRNLNTISKLIIIASLMVDVSIFMFAFEKNFLIFLFLSLILGIGQFIWWITTEILFTGISKGNDLINLYSIVWGISYFISPIIAGYIIPYTGYVPIFIISFFIIIISIISYYIFTIGEKFETISETVSNGGNKIMIESFLPSFATGLAIGILFSIFPNYVLKKGITVFELGILTSSLSITRLLGFLYLGKITEQKKLRNLMNISFLLLFSIIIPAISLNFYLLLLMMLLIGLSSSFGISAPLIYISNAKDASITKNIAVYEFSFGMSVSLFAIVFGFISQEFGPGYPYIIVFIIIIILSFIFLNKN